MSDRSPRLRYVSVKQPLTNQIYGEVCNIDADPAATKLLRSIDRRAAAAERIEYKVALGLDAVMMRSRARLVLRRVAEPFIRTCVKTDIRPDVLQGHARLLI